MAERSPLAPESVHLVDWPVADEALIDRDLSFRMAVARQVVNLGRAARNASQIKTRQPVQVAVVACRPKERAALESLSAVVAEELNVKRIDFVGSASELVSYVIKPNYRTLGPKFGKNMPAVAAAVAALPADETGDQLAAGRAVTVLVPSPIEVGPGELDGLMAPPVREYEFAPDDFVVETHEREGFKVEREGGVAVAISTVLSPELVSEGLARELVHHIQNTRKAADFQIDDRIHLRVAGPAEVAEMLGVHGEWVKKETLALDLVVTEAGGEAAGTGGEAGAAGTAAVCAPGIYRETLKVNGLPVTVEVWKA